MSFFIEQERAAENVALGVWKFKRREIAEGKKKK